jgi:hypothetical protein
MNLERGRKNEMLKLWKSGAGVLAMVALAGSALAQDAAAVRFYKLDFVVKEVEAGKVLNTRAYSTMTSSDKSDRAAIRTGTKVPYQSSPEIHYADVGVNIDCEHVHELDGTLTLGVNADLSSIPQEHPGLPPIIRQNKWSSTVILPLRKPTILFTSDDPASRQQVQLELTATPIR